MNARRIGWAILSSSVALPFVLACGGASGAAAIDAGGTLRADAAASDAGASRDAGPLGPAPDAGPEADSNNPGAYAAACLDGVDQNAGGGADCSDPSCSAAASCCVGVSSTSCCTVPGTSMMLDFACATAPCDDLTGATVFGDVGPVRTSDGAFAPESDHGTDSGAIFADELDPRAAMISITASLAVPDHTGDVDAIGVGLVTGGASAHVVPLAAVVVSAARGQILLLLGESVAGAAPAPTDDLAHDYTLTLDPTGLVTVTAGVMQLSATVPLPSGPVHAAFFGRATNPGASGSMLPARIASLRVTSSGCDQPAALTRTGGITIVDHTSAALLDTAADPSLATDGTHTYLAFAAASMSGAPSAIFVAQQESDGAFHVRAPASGTQPALAPPSGDAFESPALAFEGGVWSLYATRVHAGARSLVVATAAAGDPLALSAPTDIAVADLTGDLSSPAPIPGDPTRLVARHATSTGLDGSTSAELVLLTLGTAGAAATPSAGLCGADSSCAGGTRTQAHLYAARVATVTFDADDVDDPAIVLYDHVYRLYYAGRLGSRWSIGMLIAADLGYWRAANQGLPILAPDGSGLDAVSVRAPAPLVERGRLSLYYVGSDGDTQTMALAQGSAVAP